MDKRVPISSLSNNPYIGNMQYVNSISILYKSPTLKWSKLFQTCVYIKNATTQTDKRCIDKSSQTGLDLILDENFFT
mgnify:CR=1 FL=1